MTDNEIIEALEHCHKISFKNYPCENCPLINEECFGGKVLMKRAVDLINRQKAEIERLKAEAECAEGYAEALEQKAKAEAVKEFAERLKETSSAKKYNLFVTKDDIDNLVKEMAGAESG